MSEVGFGITALSLVSWLYLLLFRGQFWQCDQQLESLPQLDTDSSALPSICAIIPARNEADLLPTTLRSLLQQDYVGQFSIILVDDHSTDGTAEIARHTALELGQSEQLHIHRAAPLPAGWTGKLWAMHQGVQIAEAFAPDYILFTDADIQHDRTNLSRLVTQAIQANLHLASVMVKLRCDSVWEKLLIPAFVFFFQKLYPFRWVNNPTRSTAAAAGGCILVRRDTLTTIGGIAAIRHALIDDCALAFAIKVTAFNQANGITRSPSNSFNPIWLGLSQNTYSLRPYPDLKSIWEMVARTAYTQLNYSPLLLIGTLIGMGLIYLVAPIALLIGLLTHQFLIAAIGLITWLLMALAYLPTIRFYNCAPFFAFSLPLIAFLYTLMTIDSARRHWQGKGGAWKGRVYSAE